MVVKKRFITMRGLINVKFTPSNLDRDNMEDLYIYRKTILKLILQETGWDDMYCIQVTGYS